MQPMLKAPGIKHLKLNMINRFSTLLSISTCAATASGITVLIRNPLDAQDRVVATVEDLVGRCRLTP